MALSLDNLYYYQNPHQIPAQHHQLFMQPLQEGMCSGPDIYQGRLEEDDGLPSLKNWVATSFSNSSTNRKLGEEGPAATSSVNGAAGFGKSQSLSLSMSPSSQSSCVTALAPPVSSAAECMALDRNKKLWFGKGSRKQPVHRKSIDTFGQRTSQYRGVTRGYNTEEKLRDLMTGLDEFDERLESYQGEMDEMKNMNRQEFVAHLRRNSSGFSQGASIYQGVTRYHYHGRWQARIRRVAGNKDLYLGTFNTQEEAAKAYDIVVIKFRGVNAVTNFGTMRYDVEKIIVSSTLLPGELARKNKETEAAKDVPLEENPGRDPTEVDNTACSRSKVLLYGSTEAAPSTGSHDHEPLTINGDYRSPTTCASVQGADNSAKLSNAHLSNHSSLVTSQGSSQDGSHDWTGLSTMFACGNGTPKFNATLNSTASCS